MDTVVCDEGSRFGAELGLSDVLVGDHAVSTLGDLPFHLLRNFPHKVLIRRTVGRSEVALSGDAIFEQVRALSLGLTHLGIGTADRVAIISESRPEWVIADLASQCAGAVTVPVYPTQSLSQIEFILRDCDAKAVVVSGAAQLEKVRHLREALPALELVLVMEPASEDRGYPDALTLSDVTAHGRNLLDSGPDRGTHFEYNVLARGEHDLATIVYTMDESGVLKGATLTHANLLANLRATGEVLPLQPDDVALSLLPLSHVFERMALYRYMHDGVSVVFVESLMTVMRDMQRVRPTVMTGVPRVYEKFLSAVEEDVARASRVRRAVVNWSLDVGNRRTACVAAGKRVPPLLAFQHRIADRLVLSRVRQGTGGRLRYVVSGSAALPPRVATFFAAIGLPIFEGYGLTETSPVLTTNGPGRDRQGTVGLPLPGVEIRIADDGEILARGPNVTSGYRGRDDLNETAFEGGWFHTGDVGRVDAEGYLTITDRKKDLIVTAGGKKIAPSPLEAELIQHALVADAILIGENRKFPSVLIVPDFAELTAHLEAAGLPAGLPDELRQRADVLRLYQQLVDWLNASLAQFERIKRFALLPAGVSLCRGAGPHTMLRRRQAIEAEWQHVVDRLYATGKRDRD